MGRYLAVGGFPASRSEFAVFSGVDKFDAINRTEDYAFIEDIAAPGANQAGNRGWLEFGAASSTEFLSLLTRELAFGTVAHFCFLSVGG